MTRGAGKNATTETLTTIVMGIRDLPADWWSEHGSSSESNSRNFQPKLLRATVVLQWDGVPADVGKEVVLLTTDPANDPFVALDAYDDRSLIENSGNREAKEHWFLEHHPKRSEAGWYGQAQALQRRCVFNRGEGSRAARDAPDASVRLVPDLAPAKRDLKIFR